MQKYFDKYLLDILTDISLLHEEHDARLDKDVSFNVFLAMRNKHDEVRLHSRFIASLLDPEAPHNLKTLPLELFLDAVGIDKSILTGKNLEVQPNYIEKSEYEDIDILITTSSKAIIIENKINHHDSNHDEDYIRTSGKVKLKGQIERYYHCMVCDCKYQEKNVEVIYLTKEGKMPSDLSTGGEKPKYPELRDKVRCISYSEQIATWLNNLYTYCNNEIKTFIKQYISIVENMTDATNIEERKKLVSTLGKLDKNHADALAYLFDNQSNICCQIADEFWHSVIRNAPIFGLNVDCLEVHDNQTREKSQFDMYIANGLTRCIHNQKKDYFVIYFRCDNCISVFLSMNYNDDSVQMGALLQYTHAETKRARKFPKETLAWLEESGFSINDYSTQKDILVDDEYLDLNLLSCRNTIRISNEDEREIVVKNVLSQVKEFAEQLLSKLL